VMGFVEGRNLAVEYRFADDNYERLPALAVDLARRQVDVIYANGGTPPVMAAKAATTTVPSCSATIRSRRASSQASIGREAT